MKLGRALDLDDAVVVITGPSSGIGRTTARRLASRGTNLVLAARGADALDDTVEECRALAAGHGGEVIGVSTDVSDPDAVAALAAAADRRFGRIDAWVNNAGVMAYGRFDEVPMESHRQVIETNLLGTMYGAAEAMVHFRRQRAGVLVNVASLYAELTTPFVASYVTSKFGVLGFSRVLQRDLRPADGISVCCILPSSFDTPVFRHAANYHGKQSRAIPPVGDPDRVARAIVRCLEHPRKEVRVGVVGRFFAQGERLFGPVYDRVVNPAMRGLGFTSEREPIHDGNLFEAGEEWQQIDGEWRDITSRRVAVGAAAALAGVAAVVRLR